MRRSQSAQIFCPGGNCGVDGAFGSGAVTCLSPAIPAGIMLTPAGAVSGSKLYKYESVDSSSKKNCKTF